MLVVSWLCGTLVLGDVQAPPREPPAELLLNFTQNGKIPLKSYYVDDSNKGKGTHYKFSRIDVEARISQARSIVREVLRNPPPNPPSAISHGMWMSQLTDLWLIHALDRYGVEKKDIVVFGSTSPWYESLVLSMGAQSVTVVEYNHLTYEHPAITCILVKDLPLEKQFDVALSLSSFDHDGLGRYGDPINPNADVEALGVVAKVLKPSGILFLTVPIGPDLLVWNLHRRYGNVRLPLLLEGWKQLDVIGWKEELISMESPYTVAYEPVFVLTNDV